MFRIYNKISETTSVVICK